MKSWLSNPITVSCKTTTQCNVKTPASHSVYLTDLSMSGDLHTLIYNNCSHFMTAREIYSRANSQSTKLTQINVTKHFKIK